MTNVSNYLILTKKYDKKYQIKCMNNFIGLNIKHLCKENKLSQHEFGDLFNLSQNVVSGYANEKTNPTVDTIQRICDHFNITIDDFINKNLRTSRIENIWNDTDNYAKEPIASKNNEAALDKTIETQEKYIKMLEDEVKRLRGMQGYKQETA